MQVRIFIFVFIKHPRNTYIKIFFKKCLKHYLKHYLLGLEKKLRNKYAND